ncbi:MAG TPA: VOC family protein [Thermomonospora sp.]|nr:VOC family protein [Thermomonospora sp.]
MDAPRERIDVNPPDGTPSWLELHVSEVEGARGFYGALFGWTFEDDLCLLDGLPVASLHEETGGPEWRVFFAADDCDRTAARVAEAGGGLVEGPHEVGARGRAALVTDLLGARFGLWQGRDLVGTRLVNGYGTVIFNELQTTDLDRALGFYREVFGYRPGGSSSPGDLVREDGHTVAAVELPYEADEDEPEYAGWALTDTAWLTYFAVEDADVAVKRLASLGGVVLGEGPVQMAWGAVAAVRDPFGTPFRLVEPWDVI